MISIIRQAKNEYYEASESVLINNDSTAFDSILQIGHRFLRNGV